MLKEDRHMITLYTRTMGESTKNAKKWLDDHDIPYTERRIKAHNAWTYNELKEILKCTDNGFDSLMPSHKKCRIDEKEIEAKTTDELIQYFIDNPKKLRMPIMFDNQNLVVGFNKEEIRVFIPRQKRQLAMNEITGGLTNYKTLLTPGTDPTMKTYRLVL